MRPFYIVNPTSGQGRGRARWEAAAPGLPEGETAFTERRGHGAELARRALARGCDVVVAVGGDGTLGEAADGFLSVPAERRAGACLASLPAGSGCDFARHFGLTADASLLAARMEAGKPRLLDAGKIELAGANGSVTRHFLNVVSVGLGGDVAERVDRAGKRWGGTAAYLWGALSAIAAANAAELELEVDGVAERGRFHMLAAANTSATGGGMLIAPGADAQDGRLDLITAADMPRPALLRLLSRVYSGAHIGEPGVSRRTVRRVALRSRERVPVNVDGEPLGALPATIEILPGAVPFLC